MWARALDRVARAERGRVLASLIGWCGRFQLAEDALQDALEAAVETWPTSGVPDHPAAWLLTTARRKVLDRLRHEKTRQSKQDALRLETLLARDGEGRPDLRDAESVPDERLRLIFTCCHPALHEDAQVALTLRTLSGMTTGEIARAFLIQERTMGQRLVRAKQKIAAAKIPFDVPGPRLWAERLASVLRTVYLVFNEGYMATRGSSLIRRDLVHEAIRLGRVLHQLLPEEAEVEGLLALMLLHEARTRARIDSDGELVLLKAQDRKRWDRELIAEGLRRVTRALARGPVGPYQVQAAIAAVHAEAETFEATDWAQVALLYDELHRRQPTPIVALNRAVAYSMVKGPQTALQMLEDAVRSAGDDRLLREYPAMPLARADMLERLGRWEEAEAAYEEASSLAENDAVKRSILRRQKRRHTEP